jgi:hypothetical protein
VLPFFFCELLHDRNVRVLNDVALILVELTDEGFNLEESELTHVNILGVISFQVRLQIFNVHLQELHCGHLVLRPVDLLQFLDL